MLPARGVSICLYQHKVQVLSLSASRPFWRLHHSNTHPIALKLPSETPTLLPLIRNSSNLQISHGPWHTPGLQHYVATRTGENNYTKEEEVFPFFMSPPSTSQCRPIGFLKREVFKALQADHDKHTMTSNQLRSPWNFTRNRSVSFTSWVNEGGNYARTALMKRLVEEWRHANIFESVLKGWSDEAVPIYHHENTAFDTRSPGSMVAFSVERASLPLFGFANFGCLLIAFFRCSESGKIMLWVPRRSKTKKTWPGRLDVTVGGGITLGDTAMSTVIRECAEEASLDSTFVLKHIRPVGVLPFPNRSPAGWILPGIYYLYDLPLPSDGSVRPRTNTTDGEVESFELMDIETVLQNLLHGMFKPSSALALVDFLIRHGHVTEDSDPRFVDVCMSLKREMIWPLPQR
ncbi:hypothetical protein K439DRAFT_1546746 [Ramaria rubella]|nr:hypothetical protein K439DRAFT_1546746 [Ramaria rubella]